MSKFVGIVLDVAAIAGGVALTVLSLGTGVPLLVAALESTIGAALITAGTGLALSSLGTLIAGTGGDGAQQGKGVSSAFSSPIAPWNVIYGRQRVGPKLEILGEGE